MKMSEISRAEHLAWCKERALEYVMAGDCTQAFASMGSDLEKHPETKNHPGVALGLQLMMTGNLASAPEMGKFIRGFH